jgi:dimethylglycine dehydrogenase
MRLEKGYLHWKSDILTEFDPFETGLERFVRMDKGEFVGKAALERRMTEGPRRKLVMLDIDCDDRPAHGGASVMHQARVVGTVTSGGWGHRTGLNLALAFVEPDLAAGTTKLQIDMIGNLFDAAVIGRSPYDPSNLRVRQGPPLSGPHSIREAATRALANAAGTRHDAS